MANTTLANLKIGALRRVNHYNSSDTNLLALAGGLINDSLSMMFPFFRNTPFAYDLGNSKNTTAAQAYVDLVDTDILDILDVYQLVSDTKLRRISFEEYRSLVPDSSSDTGTPDLAYAVTQALNVSGQNIFTLYLVPTPSSAIALKYDYIKNIRFSTDSADTEYCALPSVYDPWIYTEFKPLFYRVISPKDTTLIRSAEMERDAMRVYMGSELKRSGMGEPQMKIYSTDLGRRFTVAATPTPT